ncbi:shikimate dehydrogenase [Lentisalinibacter orientalis]|uniref:shikimate dehydrogenase n=1 Tax=Lentisalinibacter orientalis TaxID=2992241 RepID=UPI0038699117
MSEQNRPDRYGVVGYPVSHSRSPIIHRVFAQQTGQHLTYELLEVPPAELESAIRTFQRQGGRGLNITVPHKSEAVRLADELSDAARMAGAVNTLSISSDAIRGDNTDGVGLVRDLRKNHRVAIEGARILILGAGGATRGIMAPLLEEEPTTITLANRTVSKAQALANHFGSMGAVQACRFDDIVEDVDYDLVINATSAGLRGETLPFPAGIVTAETVCYDLSYGTGDTPFTRWARSRGARRAIVGWGMLVEQAAESFYIWRGVRPDTRSVLKRLPR